MSGAVRVAVRRVRDDGAPLPAYATAGAAGIDLLAAIDAPRSIDPGKRALIPTGIAMALPPGYEGQVRPRSGLALEHGVTVLNAPGTIDEDFRGEIGVVLINHGEHPFIVQPRMRIAQVVISSVARAELAVVMALDETARGAGGYGSTGA